MVERSQGVSLLVGVYKTVKEVSNDYFCCGEYWLRRSKLLVRIEQRRAGQVYGG